MMENIGTKKITIKLVIVSLVMFAFGFALVPLYDVFCELTGLNGKTGRIEVSELASIIPDKNRVVSVEFLTSHSKSLNWEFRPQTEKVSLHLGKVHTVNYYVKNNTNNDMVVRAIPSAVPIKASAYIDKVECFCFNEQPLKAGEEKEWPVTFIIKPDLPADVRIISLAYTLFDITKTAHQTALK